MFVKLQLIATFIYQKIWCDFQAQPAFAIFFNLSAVLTFKNLFRSNLTAFSKTPKKLQIQSHLHVDGFVNIGRIQ